MSLRHYYYFMNRRPIIFSCPPFIIQVCPCLLSMPPSMFISAIWFSLAALLCPVRCPPRLVVVHAYFNYYPYYYPLSIIFRYYCFVSLFFCPLSFISRHYCHACLSAIFSLFIAIIVRFAWSATMLSIIRCHWCHCPSIIDEVPLTIICHVISMPKPCPVY